MIPLLCGLALAFDPVLEPLSAGNVDWTSLRLVAGSEGVPSSGVMINLETLEGDARSRLGPRMLKLAREVRISSTRTAGDLLDARDAVADRIDDNLSLWEVFEVRYYASGGVQMEGALPLQAWLRPALVSLARGVERTAPPTAPTSGLVVDARGLEVQPALGPRLLDGQDTPLYSLESLTALAASQRSPAVYVHDPADVAAARRAGAQPIFVKATAVKDGCDLVIDPADVGRLTAAAAEAPFLLQGNVVIVVDQ